MTRLRMTWHDYRTGRVLVDGVPLRLAGHLLELLFLLMVHRGRLVTRAAAVDFIWPDPDRAPLTIHRVLDVRVAAFRRQLPARAIETWYGVGWRLRTEAELAMLAAARQAA